MAVIASSIHHLSPATGNWDCRVTILLDGVSDRLVEAYFPDGVLHCGDLFWGMIYLGMADCSAVRLSSSSSELSVDESE